MVWNDDVFMFLTPQFSVGEPAVRTNWSATYWCPLNCSCTQCFKGKSSLNRNLILVNLLIISRLNSDPRHGFTRGFTNNVQVFVKLNLNLIQMLISIHITCIINTGRIVES